MKFIAVLIFIILFSSVFVSIAYGSIYLDKEVYTWTDKIKIRITEHGLDNENSSVRIYTSGHELDNYKLAKAGNGLYTGEIILTGFLHDVDGDGKPDTNPRTTGNGPNNGFLETKRDRGFTISVEFADGDVISKSAKISWNEGSIVFDMPNYTPNESAKLQVTDADMNLNPETLDTIQVHVFSDSDKAGILVNAIETQEESGLFETTVSFTQDSSSSGNRLFAISGDVIYAQYDDHTLPTPYSVNDDLEIIAESIINIDSIQKTILDDVSMNVVDESSVKIESSVNEKNIKSPLKQLKSGILIEDIQCKESLILVTKHDGSPACVTPNTAEKLVQRGWGTLLSGDGIDDKHTDPISSLQEDIAISIQKDNNGVITPDQIKCQIDSYTSTILGKKMVPVNIMHGNEVLEYTEVVFDGVTAMVTYNSGKDGPQLTDGGQSFLIMLMNDENGSSVNSSMYDLQLKSQSGPINVLHLDTTEKQVRLQCWV